MPCNEDLAARTRALLKRRKGITERKMFGGVAFMANGHMCCGVSTDYLVLRLGNAGPRQRCARPTRARWILLESPSKAWSTSSPRVTSPATIFAAGSSEP